MKKKVTVISFTQIADDVRIARHVKALSRNYEICTIGYGPSPFHSTTHYQIPDEKKYLPLTIFGIFSLLTRRYRNALRSTSAVTWTRELLGKIDCLVVVLNDVQTLPLMESISSDTKVVVDMHEYAPLEMEDDWRFRLLLQRYYTYLCHTFLSRAMAVTTVSEGLAERYKSDFTIDPIVILNAREFTPGITSKPNFGIIRLVHTGLAARGRHLEKMILAIGGLPGFTLTLYLVEAPRQKSTLRRLQKLCSRFDNCEIKSPVNSRELPLTIAKFDVGFLAIHPSNFSLKHCMPNKLFDCIQARRPVIVGPSPDMAKFVASRNIGIVSESFEVEALRNAVQALSAEKIRSFVPFLESVARDINAEGESEKFVSVIRGLMD